MEVGQLNRLDLWQGDRWLRFSNILLLLNVFFLGARLVKHILSELGRFLHI